MQVNPEDGPPEIYVTWSDPRMTDFKNINASTSQALLLYLYLNDSLKSFHLLKIIITNFNNKISHKLSH